MKSLAFILLLLSATVLGAENLPPAPPALLEPIHLFKIANGIVSIGVATSGYTSEQSFRLDVRKAETGRSYTLRIVRIKRDEGKMMPQPLVITYKLQDLKIDPRLVVNVENPFCSEED
jgi:hypothetical protein